MKRQDRYLLCRNSVWFYYRRVPKYAAGHDSRKFVRLSLKTTSIHEARKKRDELEAADNAYWERLMDDPETADEKGYRAAQRRAVALGYSYRTAGELATESSLKEILDRFGAIAREADHVTHDAALGLKKAPKHTVLEAFDIYINQIAPPELIGKSPNQKRKWLSPKQKAVQNFVRIVGDLPISAITREDANKFFQHWSGRIVDTGKNSASGSSGNRDLGNIRKLFTEYHRHIGDESRPNPFRNLSFSRHIENKTAVFTAEWLNRLVQLPNCLATLNRQAALILFALIETGCRPSEICNLLPENIHLDNEAPFISIRPSNNQEIKTKTSIRDIPLVGVSLAALKLAPEGFPRYRDGAEAFSALLMKYFRTNKLFPGDGGNYRIYSFRHTFEKRMLEAGLDYGLRCELMGHAISRPEYGDGGSMVYRRDELEKISLDHDPHLLDCYSR